MKRFLIIGNGNAVTYKEIFPLIKDNKIWLGAGKGMGGKAMEFYVDESIYDASKGSVNRIENGKCYVGVMMCTWFTNLDHKKRHQSLELTQTYDPNKYSRYDNYNAINVDKVCDIPEDYKGIMGVPITFLDKYCPEQFEIIWRGGDIEWAENECSFYTPPSKEQAEIYKKQDKTWRIQNTYLLDKQGKPNVVYQRIFIKRK